MLSGHGFYLSNKINIILTIGAQANVSCSAVNKVGAGQQDSTTIQVGVIVIVIIIAMLIND